MSVVHLLSLCTNSWCRLIEAIANESPATCVECGVLLALSGGSLVCAGGPVMLEADFCGDKKLCPAEGGGVAATLIGFGDDRMLGSIGEARVFLTAPARPMPLLLLTGLRTRSAGPTCELLPSPTSSLTRSFAALLSLRRSRIPLALGSRRNEPDQLLLLDSDG
jgi:hypothetical protein